MSKYDSLRGKRALVTGAASGIGRATALELAGHQAELLITDIDGAGLRETANRIERRGVHVTTWVGDISDPAFVASLAEDASRGPGGVDLLINNAGALYFGEVLDMSMKHWDTLMGVNVWGPVRLTQALLPHMVDRGSGHIVNVASVAAFAGVPGLTAYSTTKFAVLGYSEALRIELERHGVVVSVACPGLVNTRFAENGQYPSQGARLGLTRSILPTAGYSPERAARDIVRGVVRGQRYIVIGWMAHTIWALKRLSPSLGQELYRQLWPHLRKRLGADSNRSPASLSTPTKEQSCRAKPSTPAC